MCIPVAHNLINVGTSSSAWPAPKKLLKTGFCPRVKRNSIQLFTKALTFSPHNAKDAMLGATKSSKGKMGQMVEHKPPMSELNMLKTGFPMVRTVQIVQSDYFDRTV